ncbi:MAG: TetR/AcrR family transcriptional regulator [Bacteroidetes bacterium]|nr:MAG: TetR/AcrR family transcriptional regulator [Bacteroidota bacterium]REK07027.1 MAG: TetR/AcrR family transcriptional regulator [Bacteroidota bacterium]REK33626.1 MAG: TetR/AcrR family transcriptional regulator [Bacteroidota bacterium]
MSFMESMSTEQRIREAARKIFLEKGLAGARMQDIAREADLNKSLLHYYYETKENLFLLIFEDELDKFYSQLQAILNGAGSLTDKISKLISAEMDAHLACPKLSLFILSELNQETESCLAKLRKCRLHELFRNFKALLEKEVELGNVREVDAETLFVNILSLSTYPFIAKPLVLEMFDQNEQAFESYIERHKKATSKLLENYLQPSHEPGLKEDINQLI